MDTGQRGAAAGAEPGATALPTELRQAVCRPPEGGSTLVLEAAGQNVVVVLGEDGGDAVLMWAFIQHLLSGRKAVRM
jgi:hypothetical protein